MHIKQSFEYYLWHTFSRTTACSKRYWQLFPLSLHRPLRKERNGKKNRGSYLKLHDNTVWKCHISPELHANGNLNISSGPVPNPLTFRLTGNLTHIHTNTHRPRKIWRYQKTLKHKYKHQGTPCHLVMFSIVLIYLLFMISSIYVVLSNRYKHNCVGHREEILQNERFKVDHRTRKKRNENNNTNKSIGKDKDFLVLSMVFKPMLCCGSSVYWETQFSNSCSVGLLDKGQP